MAETIATELVMAVLQKLADEAFKKYVRSQGIHSELKNLGRKLIQIQDLLTDASQKEVKDVAVKRWLNDLQHLAYDIDDVLDDVATEAIDHELTPESGTNFASNVRKFIPTCCTNLALTHRLHDKLDSITTELENLYKARSDLGLVVKDERPKNTSRRNETSLLERIVIGREREKENLINKLLSNGSSSKENFSIVPIVGMGGVGKTTLARLLYNDSRVSDHFELHVWVCVSDDFDVFKISETIFRVVSKEKNEVKDLNELQIALKEKLKDKRFLLVLDDVWHENYNDWEHLVRPFSSSAPGSRIIVTTRKDKLLQKIGCGHLDPLGKLSPEDALCLFALHALDVDNFDSHPTLKPQGEAIVKKCDGLPLALKAVGILMKTKTTEEDWNDVLNSEFWDLKDVDDIIPALMISYYELSSDLKQLFAYCSLFPKDFLFDKEELVLLWMAEGLLNQPNAAKSPEQLGHDYFEILLSRSFFQHAPNEESLFMMHDLMNDLATFVSGDFFLRFDSSTKMKKKALLKHRHMSFLCEKYVGHKTFEAFKGAKCLRTFLAVSVGEDQKWGLFYLSSKIMVELLHELPLLRVLSLSCFQISEVPDVIGSLKHLRYLNLAKTNIKVLPENVGNLYNLQTLILFGCRRLRKLPESFLKLKRLRHFDIRDTPLKKLPLGISEMESLQTLTNIIIGGDNDFTITKFKGLKNITGKICIEGLHEVKSAIDAREARLSLQRITELTLKWRAFDDSRSGTLEKEVLNELKPNSNKLKTFVVECYGAAEFPYWVGDPSFKHLVHVSLHGCNKCTYLPPLGQLPLLKELFVQDMDEVKVIGSEFTGNTGVAFASLEVLKFEDMQGWEVCTINSEGAFPSLRELNIEYCPNLIDLSVTTIRSLRVLNLNQCGASVLRSLVQAASSITKLDIAYISGITDEVWRGVTQYLGAVEKVKIGGCNEIRYLWESEVEASKVFVNLKELDVWHCSGLVSLGEREGEVDDSLLSSLRKLSVASCDNIECCCCPNNIEALYINRCRSLKRVSFPTSATGGGGQKLKSLVIDYCEELKEDINTNMLMLDRVYIKGWRNLKSIFQLSKSVHLTSLCISDCPSIESFPDLQLPNLTVLWISSLKSLNSVVGLQLHNLSSLTNMKIYNCESLDSFPCGVWPPRLVTLSIGGLKKPISEWGPQDFPTSIVELWLTNEDVGAFSQLSRLLPSSLTYLRIYDFDELESLSVGLEHLTSLQHLRIWKCPKMKDLPETLLPSLLSLIIHECPNLAERCDGRGSHYWPLISHIPCIDIGDNKWNS